MVFEANLESSKTSYWSPRIINVQTYEAFRITNFTSKTKHFTALLFFLAACNKKFQRANAQPYAHDASTNKSGWTWDSQARTRLVDSLYHVFAQKQCFLCSSLSNLCCLTLHYYTLLLHRFEIFSAPGTIAHGSIRLPSSRDCLLAIMRTEVNVIYARVIDKSIEREQRTSETFFFFFFFYMKTTFKRIQCKALFTCYCCFASSLQFSNVIQLSPEGEVNGGGNTKTRSVEAYI